MNHESTPMDTKLLHKELSYEIVGAAMEVHNELGPGFLEKVYEIALMVALRKRGIECQQQPTINVHYQGEVVGEYSPDILVDRAVILELKTAESITDRHRAQAINYLKATGLRLALLINFANPKLEWERIVL